MDLLTTKEGTVLLIGPLIEILLGTISNLTSWKFMFSQRVWDMCLLKQEQITALFGSWRDRINVNLLTVHDPLATLESIPFAVFIFEDIASMVPVTIIPGPIMLETLFRWTPILVFTIGPLVPNTLSRVPLEWIGGFVVIRTPLANLWVFRMLGNKVKTSLLCIQYLFVLGIDFGCCLSIVLLSFLYSVINMATNTVISHLNKIICVHL